MKLELKIMMGLATVALLHGCGSGEDLGEVTVHSEAGPPHETPYAPCGTYNGQPVVCQPLRPDFSSFAQDGAAPGLFGEQR
jgi:hypothetical protein